MQPQAMTTDNVVSKPTINSAQKILYKTIVRKLQNDEALSIDETVSLWKDCVCQNLIKGIPHYFDPFTFNSKTNEMGSLIPLTQSQVRGRAVHWLMHGIGALIVKGYIDILPKINVKDIDKLT